MKIVRLMQNVMEKGIREGGVTIAFLGDSVTQGCFEVFMDHNDMIDTVYEKEHAYHTYLNRLLSILYPRVPVNIINAGISGDNAPGADGRLERDVLSRNPDLVVVCFGLNDVVLGKEGIPRYTDALRSIFTRLKEAGTEIIFMTPNMMNTYVSAHITDQRIRDIAAETCDIQNGGMFDEYMDAAKKVCEECGVRVCDCYAKWKKLYEGGVDVTELLANNINHPSRNMNWLFAVSLLETIMEF